MTAGRPCIEMISRCFTREIPSKGLERASAPLSPRMTFSSQTACLTRWYRSNEGSRVSFEIVRPDIADKHRALNTRYFLQMQMFDVRCNHPYVVRDNATPLYIEIFVYVRIEHAGSMLGKLKIPQQNLSVDVHHLVSVGGESHSNPFCKVLLACSPPSRHHYASEPSLGRPSWKRCCTPNNTLQ